MAQIFTLDEIKARILGAGSKASKIKFLTDEAGFTRKDAEDTYHFVLLCEPRTPRTTHSPRLRQHNYTMGIEIECANVDRAAIRRLCAERGITFGGGEHYHHTNGNHNYYEIKHDGSLETSAGDSYGTAEIVSPILRNLDSLKVVCEVLNGAGAHVNKSCGLHVHFGAADLTDGQIRRVVLNYARLEDVIDTIMTPSRRGNRSNWCRTMRGYGFDELYHNPNIDRRAMRDVYGNDRYHKVNLEALRDHGTIEFRQHAGTTNFTKIENWVKFLAALITYSVNNETLVDANTIDEIPFITGAQKAYFKQRAAELA